MPRRWPKGNVRSKRRSPKTAKSKVRGFLSKKSLKVVNMGYLFPERLIMKSPYYDNDNKSISAIAAGSCNLVYRANGLNDPLVSGPVGSTGHQPMGYDQLIGAIYENYTVKACKISIEVLSTSTTTSSGSFQVFVYPNAISTAIWTTLANVNALRENDKIRYKNVPTAYSMNKKDRSIKYYMSTKNVLGLNDTSDPDLQGTNGSDPTKQWYWNVTIMPMDESSAITCYYICKLVYYIEYCNPKPLASS